jgi:hypothetical protein
MSKSIEYILKRSHKDIKIKSALGDGSYYSINNFNYLQKKSKKKKDSTGH